MESKVKYSYDASLALYAPPKSGVAVTTITATAASTQVDINKIVNGRGDIAGRFGEGSFDVVLHVVSLDHTTGDETYSVAYNTYDVNGANAVTHDTRLLTITNIGQTLVNKFDTATLGLEDANAFYFGLNVTLAGTSPILGYWAFIAPNKMWG